MILAALKAKFEGVSEAVLGRIATKLAKTVAKEEDVQTAVDGLVNETDEPKADDGKKITIDEALGFAMGVLGMSLEDICALEPGMFADTCSQVC